MEPVQTEKKPKAPSKPSSPAESAAKKEGRKRLTQIMARANKKDYGKKIKVYEVINLALSLLKDEHIKTLQEVSLSNADRLDREFRNYVSAHGSISKDAYLGMRLNGEIGPSNASNSETQMSSETA